MPRQTEGPTKGQKEGWIDPILQDPYGYPQGPYCQLFQILLNQTLTNQMNLIADVSTNSVRSLAGKIYSDTFAKIISKFRTRIDHSS